MVAYWSFCVNARGGVVRYVGADLCRSEQGVPPHCVLRSTPQDCLASCARSPHCSGVQVDAKSAETVECLLYVESLEDAVCDTAGQRFDGVGGVVDRAEENGSGQACYAFSSERCYAFSNSELERILF